MRDHIVLIGLGKLGFSILEILHGVGEEVCVVTQGGRPDLLRRAEKLAARIILDDGREQEALREACVQSARALIIATSSDLVNLEIALDARTLTPRVPIVLRMYDSQLTSRVRRDLELAAVLNAAELSAPVFVAAALGEELMRAFEVDGRPVNIVSFRVGEAPEGAGMTLGDLAEQLTLVPVALRHGDGDYTLGPPLGRTLSEGDEIVCASTQPQSAIDSAGLDSRLREVAGRFSNRARHRKPHRWIHMERLPFGIVGHVWKNAIPGLRIAFASLLTLIGVSVGVFHFAMGLSWLNAYYFTITIVTTVGFGDFTLEHAHPLVKVFGTLLMLSGVVLLLVIYSIITDYVVRQRVEQILGARRTSLRDHVVVVGLGNIGYRVAERLRQMGEAVVAIERDETSEMAARLRDQIPVLIGDGGTERMLLRAGMDRARALVAATDDDLANLRIAHAAELLNPKVRTVARLFQSSLADKLGTSLLGVDRPLNPAQAAAATFAGCALAPHVLQGFTLGNRLLLLRSIHASDAVGGAQKTVRALREETGVLAILRRGPGEVQDLHPNDILQPDDTLVVVEEYRQKHG